MFNKDYRPVSTVVDCSYCDYIHLPYSLRQKMSSIESSLLTIRHLSRNNYKLYLLADGCILVDPIRNKILWKFDYFTSIKVLMNRIEELCRLYRYETHIKPIKTIISRNDYIALKSKYYD